MTHNTELIKKVKAQLALINKELGLDIDFIHGGQRGSTSKHCLVGGCLHEVIEGQARELLQWAKGVEFGSYEQGCESQNRIVKLNDRIAQLEETNGRWMETVERQNDEQRALEKKFADRLREVLEQKAEAEAKVRSFEVERAEAEEDERRAKAKAIMALERLNKTYNPGVSYTWSAFNYKSADSDKHERQIHLFRETQSGERRTMAVCKTWSAANGFLQGLILPLNLPEMM